MAQNDVTALIAQLNNGLDDNPDAEWQAAIALGNIDDESDKARAVQALITLMENNNAHALTRAHAVEALGKLADQSAHAVLLDASENDSYQLVRAYAIGALAALDNDENTVNMLLRVVRDDAFFGARAQAVAVASYVAGQLNDPALIQTVRDTLNNRRPIELTLNEQGVVRVIAEIDRSLVALNNADSEEE